MKKNYIYQTNNFGNSWAWIGRVIGFFIAVAVLFWVDLSKLELGSQFLLYGSVLLAVLAVIMLVWPVDELALDNKQIYFERRSLFPVLNRVIQYKISDMKGIGTYSTGSSDILSLILPVWSKNRVEIIFKDDSSHSRDLVTNKKELQKMLLKVRALMADKNDESSY